jgi:ubiquinone/menaquinone biosynthesis C-methylase UbiE
LPTEAENAAVEVFWKLHEGLSKQGPGSDASTRRALALVPELPPTPRVLDLGCGPGRQSLVLAGETGGHVTAVDLQPAFLEQLEERARAARLADRIATLNASMGDLPCEDASFDLLWSEGAIYNIGFDYGLGAWRRLLRPGCSLAVTELSWLTLDPPERIRRFWDSHYPAMRGRETNERAVAEAGYRLLGSFVLSEAEWWDDYYGPIDERIAALREQRSDVGWLAALAAAEEESSIVRDCGGAFGYVFYVMQKRL